MRNPPKNDIDRNQNRFQLLPDKVLLLAILVFAGVLRLYRLELEGLWTDEIGQVLVADNPIIQVILQAVKHDGITPLDYLFTHFSLYFGRSEGILRFPPVLWGIIAVFVIYKLGDEMFNQKTGFFAAFLLASLPIHVYYSREVRFYSLATLFALLGFLFFVRALQRNTKKDWVLFGIVQGLAFYSHYYVLAIAFVEGVWLILGLIQGRIHRSSFRYFVRATGIAFLMFLPWVIYDFRFEQLSRLGLFDIGAGFDFQPPSITSILTANFFFYPRLFNNSIWWICSTIISIFAGIIIAILSRTKDERFSSGIILLFFVYLTGVIFLLTMDAIASYFFVHRQVLVFCTFFMLIVAATLVKIAKIIPEMQIISQKMNQRQKKWIEACILLGVAFFSLWSLSSGLISIFSVEIEDWRIHRQDWRGTGEFLSANVQPDDLLLTTHNSHIRFYTTRILTRIRWLPDDADLIYNLANSYNRIWILTTVDRLRIYPNLEQFIELETPLELSLHPNLRMFIYSTHDSLSDQIVELLNTSSYTLSTLILTDFIKRGITENHGEEMYNAVSKLLDDPEIEEVNLSSLATVSGEAFMEAGDLNKASNLIHHAVSLDSTQSKTWSLLGHLYSRQNKIEKAISAYRQAILIDPSDFWAHHLMAKRTAQLGGWEEVIQIEDNAFHLAPNDELRSESLTQLGIAYMNLGDHPEACKLFSKAYDIHKNQLILIEMDKIACPIKF